MTGLTGIPLGLSVPAGPITPDFRASIERAVAEVVPPGKTAALLGVADQNGVHLAFATRTAGGWQVHADVARDWAGNLSGEVSLLKTW